ncbi:MAG: 16S rRNA (guanine(527)-N(7))-methyltransferase RsmG [Pyrinomonadaceae bacterium]|nr:16S rRNA (guanine(527)-N(7))-methyltransferase RsmG [Pyrinomonadaceae bacterium]
MTEAKAAVEDFLEALERNARAFGVQLSADDSKRLADYYEIVTRWNARLHLVAPCTGAEFATRHVLESLTALPFLTEDARVADVGSGAGLPVIPCLIVRQGVQATMIEASSKKAVFLREALRAVGASDRATVIAKRFEDVPTVEAAFVTCRAIERLTEKFQEIVEWSPPSSTLLFFAGPALQEEIEKASLNYQSLLIPESERRFLFIVEERKKPDEIN